jgi:archaeosine synthase
VRFEILSRDGLARQGHLEVNGSTARTPVMAFARTDRYAPPEGSLAISTVRDWREGGILVGPSSFFDPGPGEGRKPHLAPGHRGSPFDDSEEEGDFAVPSNMAALLLDSRRFADAVAGLKQGASLLRPAFCPVAGLPHRLAFLAYCGFDIIDSIPIIMSAENRTYLTISGVHARDELEELPCPCAACARGLERPGDLLEHNSTVAMSELRLVRHAISKGVLRELVESRVRSDPWLVQGLRLLDLLHHGLQEMHSPVSGPPFHAGSKESLSRPDVVRWRERIKERYARPSCASVLVLLPCSAKKPYSLSQSHRRFRRAIEASGATDAVHEVIVTSPLGLVPRELEMFYPAKDYDIPVTGHWDRDEAHMVQEMVSWLVSSQGYEVVLSHLGDERPIVNSVLDDFTDTSGGDPGGKESLRRLEAALRESVPRPGSGNRSPRAVHDMASLAAFQFGKAGEGLLRDARVTGRWPYRRILRGDVQLGMTTAERGMISLTLAGAEVLARSRSYVVEIEDFEPKGNLFAVGVERASRDIRIGDEAAVVHGEDVRAVGVARMSPVEMELAERGEAVRIRHWSR